MSSTSDDIPWSELSDDDIESVRDVPVVKEHVLKRGGSPSRSPSVGDEVQVHLRGTLLDGTVFASTFEHGTPYKFYLGHVNMIEGLNRAVGMMRVGEHAIFTIPSESAYAEIGFPPVIPPNAQLRFEIELLSSATVMDVCEDGGILKKIIRAGIDRKSPVDLNETFVKYSARLEEGTIVSQPKEVEFTVKDGLFCPAIAKAVQTMVTGEKVVLTVRPQYGFGEEGRPATNEGATVPPNSTVHIDLELVSWKKVRWIGKDKTILKRTIQDGQESECPHSDATVEVRLIGKLEDGTVFEKQGHDGEEPFRFQTDDDKIIYGLEIAVLKMERGEIAQLTIPPIYAFGAIESKQQLALVPSNSTVIYEVELVSYINPKKHYMGMEEAESIEAARRKGEKGDVLFKWGRYNRASERYAEGVDTIFYQLPDKPGRRGEKDAEYK